MNEFCTLVIKSFTPSHFQDINNAKERDDGGIQEEKKAQEMTSFYSMVPAHRMGSLYSWYFSGSNI